jgi:HSP20 family protein
MPEGRWAGEEVVTMSAIMTRPIWNELLSGWPLEEWTRPRPDMRMETFVEDGTFVVKAELPGIDAENDLDVEVQDGVLTIRAERKESTRDELPEGFRSEFRYGSFARRLLLPDGAVEDDVKATYADGVLEIRMPIRESKPTAAKIPVSRT